MLSVKQGGIKYHFLSLWYDSTWDWTQVSRAIGEHSNPIQVRRTRQAGHCWRSRDELIRDVLLWIPTHGRAKAGRPARTFIQQLCEDTGCCPEDLPRAMNDREEWRERVRDIRATSAIWWWWWNVVKNFLLFLSNANNSNEHYSFVCTQLNGFKEMIK